MVTRISIFDFTPSAVPGLDPRAWRAPPAHTRRSTQSAGCFPPPPTLTRDRRAKFHITGCAPAAKVQRQQADPPAILNRDQQRFTHHQPCDVAAPRSEGGADSNLTGPAGNLICDHAVDPDSGEDARDQPEGTGEASDQAFGRKRVLHLFLERPHTIHRQIWIKPVEELPDGGKHLFRSARRPYVRRHPK